MAKVRSPNYPQISLEDAGGARKGGVATREPVCRG
jgi:hypothetical protein